ncbi:hypothetical protein SAPIO_CDS3099 [Scedosporium apiospermum]|uniref:Uncharacterized protein n=1 Tax=Pseudallescheria apiosperma TaxID=563466 RepID=A0A084GA12_PSEDA|nr:uncharacterized protein SAPIO_CDS3099 [Scedosporium apiospermum]KEZ44174.1 hypothetical protein SAPIO_CDS3099 [Scedosporium apiospermum]
MAPTNAPAAEIAPLPNADGSVIFSYAGYKVVAAANGPVETLKREEYAFEALVMEVPENEYENGKAMRYNINLPAIPALLHAAILALLSGAVPLKGIATAALLIVPGDSNDGKVIVDPTAVQIAHARSVHVLGFTSEGDLLLAESEGQFSLDEWDEVVRAAQKVCLQSPDEMSVDEGESTLAYVKSVDMKQFIRTVMASKVAADLHWKISV